MKSIETNLKATRALKELTLVGFRMSEACASKLNQGILRCSSLRKLRLNFVIYRSEILEALMPCLTTPCGIEDVNLSCNHLDDSYCYLINKILSSHQEEKDEQVWKYGLRNEKPPRESMLSLKKLNLSHNQLGLRTVRIINRTIKSDQYCRALNLRANNLCTEAVSELYDALKDNATIFNLDLRQNPGLSQKMHRLLALKMLQNYTKSGQMASVECPETWKLEQKYFNPKLLIVEIPTRMIKTYARKLEDIRNTCFLDHPRHPITSTNGSKKAPSRSPSIKKS